MRRVESFYKKPDNLDIVMEEYNSLLDRNGILSMPKMEWFLMKYEDLNDQTCNYFKYLYLYETEDGGEIRIPVSFDRLDCEDFMDLYQTLKYISDVIAKKEYYQKELEVYSKIKDSKKKLREWVIKNEKIGDSDNLLMYCFDWEECAKNDIIYFSNHMPGCLSVKVYKRQFMVALKYYNIFFELFHHQRLYPESKSTNLPKILSEEEQKQIIKEFEEGAKQKGFL